MGTDWGSVVLGLGSGVIGVVGTLLSAGWQSRRDRNSEKERREQDRVDRRSQETADRLSVTAAERTRLIHDVRVAYVDGYVALSKATGDANADTSITSARAVDAIRAAAHQVATVGASLAVVNGLRSETAITLLNRVLERVKPFIEMTLDLSELRDSWSTNSKWGTDLESVEAAIENLIEHVDAQQLPHAAQASESGSPPALNPVEER